MTLDLNISTFEDAAAKLEQMYELAATGERQADEIHKEAFHMAAIKAFETAYSSAIGVMKRFLSVTGAEKDDVDNLDFRGLVRLASARGLLLNDLSMWDIYRQRRNAGSHIYSEKVALEVFAVIPDFIREVRFLRDELRERIAHT